MVVDDGKRRNKSGCVGKSTAKKINSATLPRFQCMEPEPQMS